MADCDATHSEVREPLTREATSQPRNGPRSLKISYAPADVQHAREVAKAAVNNLQFGRGAPGTRYAQQLWVKRFEKFRTVVLEQDVAKPFTVNDLIGFFAVTIPHQAVNQTKPAPSKKSILRAIDMLVSYGFFMWDTSDGFRFKGHQWSRVKQLLFDMTQQGRLTTGYLREKTWIGFAALSRLIRVYLEKALQDGTVNWDVVLAKCLSMVLVSSLGARGGDVARARRYEGQEYMQFRHVELYLEKDEPKFENLAARVTIEFAKGYKNVQNAETLHYLQPLNSAHSNHMCAIALLLIHCLRHSLVEGTTLQDVLENAGRRRDRRVVWLFPDRPILCAFAIGPLRCLLDEPAGCGQLLETIKEMGLTAGMVDNAYTHGLRLGFARDVAHLPSATADGAGLTTDVVRESIGHTRATMSLGTTDRYVGGSTVRLYNHRALATREPIGREPRFAVFIDGNTVYDARDTTSKMLMEPTPLPNAALGVGQSRRVKEKTNLPEASTAQLYTLQETLLPMMNGLNPETEVERPLREFTKASEAGIMTEQELYDANQDVDSLDEICGTNANSTGTPEAFIDSYARYNIVDTYYFAREWDRSDDQKREDLIQTYCQRGGSRDEPSLLLHRCTKTNGCTFTTFDRAVQKSHQDSCDEHTVNQLKASVQILVESTSKWRCTYPGCSFEPGPLVPRPSHALSDHVRNAHNFEAKACEHGCEPGRIYHDESSYRYHLSSNHSGRWPSACRFTGCTHLHLFANHASLKYHLSHAHGLDNVAMLEYFPPLPAVKKWVAQSCTFADCEQSFLERASQTEHLRRKHGLSLEDARRTIEELGEFEQVVPEHKVRSKRAPSKMSTERAVEGEKKRMKTS